MKIFSKRITFIPKSEVFLFTRRSFILLSNNISFYEIVVKSDGTKEYNHNKYVYFSMKNAKDLYVHFPYLREGEPTKAMTALIVALDVDELKSHEEKEYTLMYKEDSENNKEIINKLKEKNKKEDKTKEEELQELTSLDELKVKERYTDNKKNLYPNPTEMMKPETIEQLKKHGVIP